MAKCFIEDTTLTAIADAIRELLGVDTTYLPSEMPDAIRSMAKKSITLANMNTEATRPTSALSLPYTTTFASRTFDIEFIPYQNNGNKYYANLSSGKYLFVALFDVDFSVDASSADRQLKIVFTSPNSHTIQIYSNTTLYFGYIPYGRGVFSDLITASVIDVPSTASYGIMGRIIDGTGTNGFYNTAGTSVTTKKVIAIKLPDSLISDVNNGYTSYQEIIMKLSEMVQSDVYTYNYDKNNTLKIVKQPINAKKYQYCGCRFNIAAKGKGLSYQWQVKTSSSGSWTNSTYNGNNTYSVYVSSNNVIVGHKYRCIITDADGVSITSDEVEIVS